MDEKFSFSPGFEFESWKNMHAAFADEAVPKWVDEVKSKYGKQSTKYACVGYMLRLPDIDFRRS